MILVDAEPLCIAADVSDRIGHVAAGISQGLHVPTKEAVIKRDANEAGGSSQLTIRDVDPPLFWFSTQVRWKRAAVDEDDGMTASAAAKIGWIVYVHLEFGASNAFVGEVLLRPDLFHAGDPIHD